MPGDLAVDDIQTQHGIVVFMKIRGMDAAEEEEE